MSEDKGSHYRYSYTVKVTEEDLERGFVSIKLDPYRICKICSLEGGPLEHIAKKSLRGMGKGHSLKDLYKEIICCAERGLEMIEEDENNAI